MPQVSGANDPLWEQAQFTYQNGVWRRQPMIFGYTDRWSEEKSNLNAAAGANLLTTTAVPAGYIYVLQVVTLVDGVSNTTGHDIIINNGGVGIYLLNNAGATAGKRSFWYGSVVLKEGDTVSGQFVGCTLNDDIYFGVWGYKMKIND